MSSYAGPETERVAWDILELSKGGLERVRHHLQAARTDFRDILYWAEYYDRDPMLRGRDPKRMAADLLAKWGGKNATYDNAMNQRPPSITIISWLFILVGGIGFLYHLSEFMPRRPMDLALVGVCLIRLVAIFSGVLMLRGANWARWLLIGWMIYHVILSAFHSLSEAAMHIGLFSVVALFLFRPAAATYFRGTRTTATQSPKGDNTRVA